MPPSYRAPHCKATPPFYRSTQPAAGPHSRGQSALQRSSACRRDHSRSSANQYQEPSEPSPTLAIKAPGRAGKSTLFGGKKVCSSWWDKYRGTTLNYKALGTSGPGTGTDGPSDGAANNFTSTSAAQPAA